MGVICSCPLATYFDLENGFEFVVASSISLAENETKRSISFEKKDSEPKILQSSGSGKLEREGSIRFRSRKTMELRFCHEGPSEYKCNSPLSLSGGGSFRGSPRSPVLDQNTHEAAIKLQKVYKSFRTRRKLADCAVLIEQSWWKLLDFAELKHSSISFFDLEKHETAVSRWSRARTRAAKVGKGLSKNGKAQKLALQHWLEAIDPRHRYGHNLHFYYAKWLNSQSREPFFYWLDIGEGKEVNLSDKCPRLKLQQQCIKYLGPMERNAYEVTVEEGKLLYKPTGELLNTVNEPKGVKWIFVLSTSKTLYVAKKMKGSFQHSSFLAGGATLAAGRIVAEHGVLKAVWPHSGHYKPTPENFQDFISFLNENNVDLTDVKLDSIDDEEESTGKNGTVHFRSNSSGDDLTESSQLETEENYLQDSTSDKTNSGEEQTLNLNAPQGFTQNLTTLQIPGKADLLQLLKGEQETNGTAEQLTRDENIPEESILRRINSHKETKSFQLGKQLSCKWSTGAGPRIGCVRDYPTGLQSQALEQVNLSPRSQLRLRFDFLSRSSTPNGNSTLSRASSR